jgi:hypothetical protein
VVVKLFRELHAGGEVNLVECVTAWGAGFGLLAKLTSAETADRE